VDDLDEVFFPNKITVHINL